MKEIAAAITGSDLEITGEEQKLVVNPMGIVASLVLVGLGFGVGVLAV